MSTHTHYRDAPMQVTVNKLLSHKDTKNGSRLWQRGAYYTVIGDGGKGVGEHWICIKDSNQDHAPNP